MTVNADTGRLTVQLAKGGQRAGSAAARAIDRELNDIGGAGLTARLKVIRQKAEAALAELDIDVGVDDAKARADLKRIEQLLRAQQLELKINPEIDDPELQKEIANARRVLLNTLEADVDVKIDEGDVKLAKAYLEFLFEKKPITQEIKVKADDTSILSTQAKIRAAFFGSGQGSGDAFAKGLSTRTKAITAAVFALGEPAIVGLEGLAASLTAVTSSAVLGLTAGIGALSAQFVGLGNILLGAGTGLKGFGAATGAINEELADAVAEGRAFNARADSIIDSLRELSPAARETALAFADVREQLADSQELVQEQLFTGLADTMESLADEFIPNATRALQIGARQANVFVRALAEIGNDTDFADIFEDLEPTMEAIVDAALAFARTFEPFMRAVTPAAELLAVSIRDTALSFEDFVTQGERTGELTQFFIDGVRSLQEWGRLLGAAGDALGTLFAAGQSSGDGFVVSLTKIIERWDEWMESIEGQMALDNFFQGGEEIIGALTPILVGLKEAFDVLVTPDTIGRFADLATSIGQLLPVVAELFEAVSSTGLLTETLSALAIGFGALAPAIGLVADAIGVLSPVLGPLLAAFLVYRTTIGPLAALNTGFSTSMLGVAKSIGATLLAAGPAGLAIAGLATAVGVASLVFLNNQAAARKAAEEVEEYVAALRELRDDAESLAVVETVLANLKDESKSVREAFDVVGISIGDWAADVVDGTASATSAFIEFLEGIGGPEAQEFADQLATGVLSIDDFSDALLALPKDQFRAILAEAGELGIGYNDLIDAADFLSDETGELVEAQAELELQTREAGSALDDESGSADELAGATARAAIESDLLTVEQLKLAGGLEEASEAARFQLSAVNDLADANDAGAEKASAFSDAIKTLIDPTLNVQEASDGWLASIQTLGESLGEAGLSTVTFQDLSSGLGENFRDLRANVRDNVDSIFEYGDALLASGESSASVQSTVLGLRDSLIAQLEGWGLSRDEAETYVDQLGLVPEVVGSAFETPGLDEAVSGTGELVEATGNVADNVSVAYEAPELPGNIQLTEDYQGQLDDVDASEPAPEFSTPGLDEGQSDVDFFQETLDGLPFDVEVEITVPNVVDRTGEVEDLQRALDDLPATETISINLPGINSRIAEVDSLKRSIDSLYSRTVTITTRNVVSNIEGNMTGAIVAGETIRRVGERGLAEAIIPLQLPLNRVDPSVRDMAAMLRGDASAPSAAPAQPSGPKTVHNHQWKIVETDRAETTAQRVMNRLARDL